MSRRTDTESKRRKIEIDDADGQDAPVANEGGNGRPEEDAFRVEDRRHWVHPDDDPAREAAPRTPSMIDEYRERSEAAERKLQEYIEAFKGFKKEQEDFRERMNRDVDRRVDLQFGGLVEELLEAMDNLDLALDHVAEVPEAETAGSRRETRPHALPRGARAARRRKGGSRRRRLRSQRGRGDTSRSGFRTGDVGQGHRRASTGLSATRPRHPAGPRGGRPAQLTVRAPPTSHRHPQVSRAGDRGAHSRVGDVQRLVAQSTAGGRRSDQRLDGRPTNAPRTTAGAADHEINPVLAATAETTVALATPVSVPTSETAPSVPAATVRQRVTRK